MDEEMKTSNYVNTSKKEQSLSYIGKPRPIDFETFIPWICLELQVPYDVFVSKTAKEEYIPQNKKHSLTKSRHNKTELRFRDSTKKSLSLRESVLHTKTKIDGIPVTAFYDTKGHLTEISIVDSPYEIPRKLIIAFTVCVPFHASLEKISICNGKISLSAIQEISKLLPHSNITNVYLERCRVSDGYYHLLLDQISQLKYLALRHLNLTDNECKEITKRLEVGKPASMSLLSLDLTSNELTDDSARAFGEMLRRNRNLLSLNLCDNKIGDVGASYILESLMVFSLTEQEKIELKRRRLEFFIKRVAFYNQSALDLTVLQNEKENKENKRHNKMVMLSRAAADTVTSPKKGNSRKIKKEPEPTIDELAEKMTKENIGDFIDAFEEENLTYVGRKPQCIGNLHLCSLNISYNKLSYFSVRKISEVLQYQDTIFFNKPHRSRGLFRIVFEGNDMPPSCREYDDIYRFLNRAIIDNTSRHSISLKANKRTAASSIHSVNIGRSTANFKKH